MKNIDDMEKKSCCGCRACEQICPKKAINFIENEEGFLEPKINEKLCVNCGLCVKRCPQLNRIENDGNLNIRKVFAVKNKNVEEQSQSSSGGIFPVIAKYVINQGGVVDGCAFNEQMEAEHRAVDNIGKLEALKGSKYVQSNTKNTYSEVKENLEKNIIVLYVGTPCQIAGLKKFLIKNYENLITVDLLCHGVPSPKFFKKYVEWLEKKYKGKVLKYNFRDKEKSAWGLSYKSRIVIENKKKFIKGILDPYISAFIKGEDLRECCYSCKYTNEERIADITIGDFWGVEKEIPKFYDTNGVSVCILNSIKGRNVFENVSDCFNLKEVDIKMVKRYADTLREPCKRGEKRDEFYKNINSNTFMEELNFSPSIKDKIKGIVPDKLKLKIKGL